MFFRPRTRPKTSLQFFALEQRESKAKHCRDALGRVLGRKNKVQNQSLNLASTNPHYDKRWFIDLPVQYMKTTSPEHVVYMSCFLFLF